jgi:hypothetical protein
MTNHDLFNFKNSLHDEATVYDISISGKVTTTLLGLVESYQIRKVQEDGVVNLICQFPDQSGLLGLLNSLNDTRHEILSVRVVPNKSSDQL